MELPDWSILFILICCIRIGSFTQCPAYKILSSVPNVEPDDPALASSEQDRFDVPGLINKYGYIASVHHVITEDKYNLTLHRVVGKKEEQPSVSGKSKPIVLLVHGLAASSAVWVVNEDKSPAFLLSDEGYDVWCANARGSYYSRSHATLNPDKCEGFWDFSFHEVGYYDLPAMIDYILGKTGRSKLQYVGHSMGTTAFFVMASTRKRYNEKVVTMHALAPSAYLPSLLKNVGKTQKLEDILQFLLQSTCCELLPKSQLAFRQAHKYCIKGSPYFSTCINLFNSMDEDLKYLNASKIPLYLSHFPAGASNKQAIHYLQISSSKEFRQYDYGPLNYIYYSTLSPPNYNLGVITTPIFMYYGKKDGLTKGGSILRLEKELGGPTERFEIPFEGVGHASYFGRWDVIKYVHETIVGIMKKYE